MTNVVDLNRKTTFTLTVDLTAEQAALINKFLAANQHTRNTHGPMTSDKLAQMLLEDIAAAAADSDSWQGAHMALVLSEHGYVTG